MVKYNDIYLMAKPRTQLNSTIKSYAFNPQPYHTQLKSIINSIESTNEWKENTFHKILKKHPRDGVGLFSRDQILTGYKYLIQEGEAVFQQRVQDKIKMKPVRSISGVTTVTVLTKPFPCPGKCIFCPNDVRMPKSYLADEPGAQRAERNNFDPYLQTYNRLKALQNIGHNTEKIELIVLGGTWSFYPEEYQIWFIKRCFEALNDFPNIDQRENIQTQNIYEEASKKPFTINGQRATYNQAISHVATHQGKGFFTKSELASWDELFSEHKKNETAHSKCVGLVIETRPDYIDAKEVLKIRKLGATKVQIGIQSLNDTVMSLNKRGHGRKETEKAIELLRQAGFKIHAHWMPNLLGSTVESDIADYKELWSETIRPDELKIYPCSIIANTELNEEFKKGNYKPYSYEELLEVLSSVMPLTPRYCRLTRVIRDIPSTDIVEGNKLTHFRQIAENKITADGERCQCIRCREVKSKEVSFDDLELEVIEYQSSMGKQYFLSYKTKTGDNIAGFLRLSIPDKNHSESNFIEELRNKAMIREIHVYGQVVGIGEHDEGKSQHLGLGTKLIEKAKEIALENSFKELSVISAIGTREYYKKKGFHEDGLYMAVEI
jgi:elongator complex protein 3